MNFSKKLLALFLLFFIPIFGINSFNVVNNKQNQILSDYQDNSNKYGDMQIFNCLKIISFVPEKETYANLKETEYIKVEYSVDTSLSTPENPIDKDNIHDMFLTVSLVNGEDRFEVDNLQDNLKISEENPEFLTGSTTFSIPNLDINTKYKYRVDIIGQLYSNDYDSFLFSETGSAIYLEFETGDPYSEPVATINASSIKTNFVHLDFKLTINDWITIDPNGIKLNLYKKGESEPISSFSTDEINYQTDLTNLESNTDYYINGSVNFTRKLDSSSQSININNYYFKTLKPWYARTSGIIGIFIIILLLLLIPIMIWYFMFYRVKVKKKQLRKELNF